MAVEQDLLANLTDAERAELEQRAIQLRELKKKVGTQRALQIIGSGFAIAGNKPELLPHLTPKFGYTADEIASRKGALRRERHALMGEDEAAKQFSQTLLKDVQKDRLGHKNALVGSIQRMYTAAAGEVSASARKKGDIDAKAGDVAYKEGQKYQTMRSLKDRAHGPAVVSALDSVKADMGGEVWVDKYGRLTPTASKLISDELNSGKLNTPGQKKYFIEEIGARHFNGKDKFLADLRDQRKGTDLLPGTAQAGVMVDAYEADVLLRNDHDTKREDLLDEAADRYFKAGRAVYGPTWNQKLFDQVQESMEGLTAAETDEEADEIMQRLVKNLEGDTKGDHARQNEIENLRKMEEAYDKDLGPAPVRKAYRLMEQSAPVQKLKAELTAAPPQGKGYTLTDKQVVKLILKNSRQELIRTGKVSSGHFNLLSQLVKGGMNINAKEPTEVPTEAESPLVQKDMMSKLTAKAAGYVPDAPTGEPGATITQGANTLLQMPEEARALAKVQEEDSENLGNLSGDDAVLKKIYGN